MASSSAARDLGVEALGGEPRHPRAARAPQQPGREEAQREHRRPAQQAVVAVDPQRRQARHALQVVDRETGARRAVARSVGGVGREAAEEAVVEREVEDERAEHHLGGGDRRKPAASARGPAHEQHRDRQAGERVLGPEPGQRGQQHGAAERVAKPRALAQRQRRQRRAGQQRAGGQLGMDARGVGERGRGEPGQQGGRRRPRLGHHPAREQCGEHEAERRDRGEEELDEGRAAERVGGRDQQREADAVRLVAAPERELPVGRQRAGIEARVGARRVLVAQVEVAVGDDRLGGEQVVRLVAAVLRAGEGVDPERRRVGGEQDRPERQQPRAAR